jgi:NAD(P) transhydrogenase subunit alpha
MDHGIRRQRLADLFPTWQRRLDASFVSDQTHTPHQIRQRPVSGRDPKTPMNAFVCREKRPLETRVALDPPAVARWVNLGIRVGVEAGAGLASGHSDASYLAAGAEIPPDAGPALAEADWVLRVRPPEPQDIARQKTGSVAAGFMDPFGGRARIEAMVSAGVSGICMELIPRTTLAQKMDALSSQANLAGYAAVLMAADRLDSILPMMMTPAGTISPARVFVIGVGVAGLQAIATARRLGARVEAFDTRPVVEEQVRSLGAKFVKIDIGETGQTDQGYARELTPEQVALQQAGMAKVCAASDIVITTAKVFGREAPRLVTAAMLAGMRSGAVVVDLAAGSGGNVEGTRVDEEVVLENGVRILGWDAPECRVPRHASQVYAANLSALMEHFHTPGACPDLDRDDAILTSSLLVHRGRVHERFTQS